MREWSVEGAEERRPCFDALLGALDQHVGTKSTDAPRVLCPGGLLGRLPFELTQRGYQCDSCESRSLMFFASELIRQKGSVVDAFDLQPFALNTCNRYQMDDHVRHTPVPDVPAVGVPSPRFGDFLQLYGTAEAASSYAAVLTAFSLDKTANILQFVRTVAHVVKPGGMWANFGPLASDSDQDEDRVQGLELSWEELRHALSFFFDVKTESYVNSNFASNQRSMMELQYSCLHFVAVRKDTPAGLL